jgi:hypothetical protein
MYNSCVAEEALDSESTGKNFELAPDAVCELGE